MEQHVSEPSAARISLMSNTKGSNPIASTVANTVGYPSATMTRPVGKPIVLQP